MARVNAPDGTPLVYDAYEPAKPAVAMLFLHDWHPAPLGLWHGWADRGSQLRDSGLAAYFLDQRGQGRSGGRRGHLSRFSQLLGDLQAFRRAVRQRHDVPQVLVGHGFGALVVLRYLETQPGEPPAAAVVSNPLLASPASAPIWKRLAAKLADLWPTLPTGRGDGYMTAGARAEVQWAQRAIVSDCRRIERPVMFLLGGADRSIDLATARHLAEQLPNQAQVKWYPELAHELFGAQEVVADLMRFATMYRSSDHHPRGD